MTSTTGPAADPHAGPPPPPSSSTDPEPPRRRLPDGPGLGWGLALIAGGALWLLALADVPIRWELVLPIAVLVTGLLVLALGPRGGAGGLVGFGAVLAVIALGASIGGVPWSLSAGDRVHTPQQVAELDERFDLGAGTMTVDLRDLDLAGTAGQEIQLRANVSMGELVVRLPAEVELSGRARVGMGEVVVDDQSRSGVAPSLDLTPPGDGDGVVIDLELRVGLGRIEVTR